MHDGGTGSRPGQFGCFGLHEWAMVYRAAEHRHAVPLRLGQEGTDAVVEASELRCTHLDAFRFFTPEAVSRNARVATPTGLPTREAQADLEQPGCLHAGMDLYKWAVKLGPLELSVKQEKTVQVPVWLSVGAVVIGAGLLLVGGKKG